ncbi:hypothetical protein TNIN_163121 [Trichonephila inaurata madagascariensis]|uniref:CHHC U11-48K-type domain-containing protein n=1 Tax=Trichonephila inaurata madagascariensis TaxID=2747483 RepID=A0A8X6IC52_9ARAC|nr:hypothetical protein TNIN_163121 [Trichonephila inaurata madagascariensis]
MDVNSRMKFIEDLDSYILEKNQSLSNICNELEWTEESLLDEKKVQCPCDPNHWVVESSLSPHIKACSWVKDGYLKEEVEKQPPDSEFFYKTAPSVIPITIDKETQANILIENGLIEKKLLDEMPDVPKTVDGSRVDLNLEQRLAIYDHIIKEAKKNNASESVTLEDLMFDFEKKEDQEDKPKSQLEILAEQRDYKRRRQSYRAKNVHITKKSYTEILKELIENQTNMLAFMQKQEASEKQYDPDSDKGEKKELELRQGDKSPSTRETSPNGYKQVSRKRDRSPRDSSYKHESRKREWSPSERDPHYNDYYYESRKRDRRSISRESSYDGYKYDSKKRDKNSSAKESSCDDYKHASRDRRSRSRSRKKKKHKYNRSRSRSRSHTHKKSHKKHKKSYD